MKINSLFLLALVLTIGCREEERKPIITIVDIGHMDSSSIAKQIQVINKYSPRVIALDFMLTTDSLERDVLMSEVLANTPNVIHSSVLHNYQQVEDHWDSLETYHSKFKVRQRGFSNMKITRDSVIVAELPMRQYYREEIEPALSFVIAEKSFGVRSPYNHDPSDSRYYSFDKSGFRKDFKIISSADLLNERFAYEDIHDKIVIMGHTSGGDSFYLDHEHSEKISGVEIQANFVMEIIDLGTVD